MIMSNIKYCIRIGILFLAGIIVFGCNEDRQNEKDSDIFQINIPLTSGDKPLFAVLWERNSAPGNNSGMPDFPN